MASKKKPVAMSASDIEKALASIIKSATEQLTQWGDAAKPSCFARRVIQMKPADVTQLDYDAVFAILREKMPMTPGCQCTICDAFITTYPPEIFSKFMDYAQIRLVTASPQYQCEQYDCDDFSLNFAALARQWHARIRAKLQESDAACALIPESPRVMPHDRIIPHVPRCVAPACAAAAAPSTSAAAASSTALIVPPMASTHYLGGSPIGMCHGRTSANSEQHAFNFWIAPTREIVFIEPQTCEYIMPGDGARIDFIYI